MPPPHESRTAMVLKKVEVLECVPGNAKKETGPPITIITLAHKGEIEAPMAISIKDTEMLLVDCLVSLAHHGDDFADMLLKEYFVGDDDT